MKLKGPELGSISSRFFAHAQLKKLDIVRIGEIALILDISAVLLPSISTILMAKPPMRPISTITVFQGNGR